MKKIILITFIATSITLQSSHQALFDAVNAMDLSGVQRAIANHADVNTQDRHGHTALHYAAINNAADVAQLLITNYADVNAKNSSNSTALHYTAEDNASDVAKLLIANGADIPTDLIIDKKIKFLDKVIEGINSYKAKQFKRSFPSNVLSGKQVGPDVIEMIQEFDPFLPSATDVKNDPKKKALADRIQENVRNEILKERQAKEIRLRANPTQTDPGRPLRAYPKISDILKS